MIRLTCAVSLASIAAMIDSIDLIASLEIRLVCSRACSARVRTAVSTASRARSVLGLNSCSSRLANSLVCSVVVWPWARFSVLNSAMLESSYACGSSSLGFGALARA